MGHQSTTSTLGGGQAWLNWSISVLFVVFVFTLQTGYAITNVSVAQDLSLTMAQVGFVGTIYTFVFAITQLVSGSILDKIGTRWVLPIACLVVAAGAFLFANASGPKMLVFSNVLAAIGASFGFIGAGFTGGQWFSPLKYGFMFALVQLVASLSAIIGQSVLGVMIEQVEWFVLINGLAIIGVVIAIVMLFVLRDPQTEQAKYTWPGLRNFFHELFDSLSQVVSIRDTWLNALIGGATMGTMLGLGVIWGPRLLASGGMEQGASYFVSSLAWAGLAIGAPLFSWISDKVKSRVKPMIVACILQLLIIIIILSNPESGASTAAVLFFLFGVMAGASMLPFTIAAELVSPTLIGTSAALVNATQFVIGGFMMAIPGRVLDGTGVISRIREGTLSHLDAASSSATIVDYQWAISIMPVTLCIGLFLCFFLKETYPQS
ncbi:MAG: MFS transporter [Methylomarinum sp.]|nr:MFS transporter [Methylomarinum sp.]